MSEVSSFVDSDDFKIETVGVDKIKEEIFLSTGGFKDLVKILVPLEVIKILIESKVLKDSEKVFLINFFIKNPQDFTYQELADVCNTSRKHIIYILTHLEKNNIINVIRVNNSKKINTIEINFDGIKQQCTKNWNISELDKRECTKNWNISELDKRENVKSQPIPEPECTKNWNISDDDKSECTKNWNISSSDEEKNDEQNSHIIRNKIDKSILYNNISKHHDERDAFDDLENTTFSSNSFPSLLKPLEQEDIKKEQSVVVEPKLNSKLSDASQIMAVTISKMREVFEPDDLVLVDSVLDNQKLLRRSTKIAKTVEEQWTKVLYESYMGKLKHDREEHEIDKESWRESVVAFIDKTTDSNIRNTNYLIKIFISKSQQRKKFNSFTGQKASVMTNGNTGYKDAGYTSREEFDKIFKEQDEKMESQEIVIMEDYWN